MFFFFFPNWIKYLIWWLFNTTHQFGIPCNFLQLVNILMWYFLCKCIDKILFNESRPVVYLTIYESKHKFYAQKMVSNWTVQSISWSLITKRFNFTNCPSSSLSLFYIFTSISETFTFAISSVYLFLTSSSIKLSHSKSVFLLWLMWIDVDICDKLIYLINLHSTEESR